MTTLAAIWACRYPIAAAVAIVYAASAIVMWREARNAPLVDVEPPAIYVEVDPDESVAAVLGWDVSSW